MTRTQDFRLEMRDFDEFRLGFRWRIGGKRYLFEFLHVPDSMNDLVVVSGTSHMESLGAFTLRRASIPSSPHRGITHVDALDLGTGSREFLVVAALAFLIRDQYRIL
jgi:hypothetical protein